MSVERENGLSKVYVRDRNAPEERKMVEPAGKLVDSLPRVDNHFQVRAANRSHLVRKGLDDGWLNRGCHGFRSNGQATP